MPDASTPEVEKRMVTWFKEVYRSADDTVYREGVCLSTDTKPTPDDMCNGSKLEEMDTGDKYRYDRDSGDWITPQAADNNAGWPASTKGV